MDGLAPFHDTFEHLMAHPNNCDAAALFGRHPEINSTILTDFLLLGTILSFKYRSYHVFDDNKEVLLTSRNPFALIALACQNSLLEGKIPYEELAQKRLIIAKALLKHGFDRDRITSFLGFLKNFIFIDNEDINSNGEALMSSIKELNNYE